ncbi:hypothetical protein ACQPW1_21745 [Nocardia sp. CA-128927]|uniref:hypothetical protein n=1 Tax=Nocardia sp. CA-128927 TaxID=3239975 RepID=UPI003D960119
MILKGRRAGVDQTAQSWLTATELAGDTVAAARLSRAIDPARYGFAKRAPLDLALYTGEAAAVIIELLEAGQVPTPDAVNAAVTTLPGNRVCAVRDEERVEIKQFEALIRTDVDSLGEAMSSSISLQWANYGVGPTWQEAWQSDPVVDWWILALGEVPEYRLARKPTFTILDRAGWITSNRTPRSLCTGRRFYNRFHGDHVSPASAATVGHLVARYIGIYRRLHGDQSPSWEQIAASTADRKGIPLFFSAADGRAQQRWLITQGWIRIQDDQLRRGERAKAETNRRTALRKASASLQAA